MSDDYTVTIGSLKSLLKKQEDEVRATKQMINRFCRESGQAMLFPDADSGSLDR